MPRLVKPLQPADLPRLLKTPKRHFDGGGLQLRVTKKLIATWLFKFTSPVTKTQREIVIGPYPAISLADARKQRVELREQLRQKKDPLADRDAKLLAQQQAAEKALTVRQCCEAYITGPLIGRDPKTIANWWWSLRKHVFGVDAEGRVIDAKKKKLADMPIAAADVNWAEKILMWPHQPSGQPFWHAAHPTAKHVRERLEIVFRYATKKGMYHHPNPMRMENGLDDILSKSETIHEPGNFADLHYSKVPEFLAWLYTREDRRLRYRPANAGPYQRTRPRWYKGRPPMDRSAAAVAAQYPHGDCRMSCCVQLAVLSGLRISEARGARWEEFDFNTKIWSIPKERMKGVRGNKKPHRVPLSTAMLEVLEKMKKFRDDQLMPYRDNDVFVFPGDVPGQPISRSVVWLFLYGKKHGNASHGDAKERFGPMTTHGFRTAIDEWGRDHGYGDTLRDLTLAHVTGSATSRHYGNRPRPQSDMLEQRRALVEGWGQFCTSPVAPPSEKVVPLLRRRSTA